MDVLEAIRTRRSVRAYDHRAIAQDVLHRMQQAIRSAPSACNYQPWRFVFVHDPGLRLSLAHACNDQMFLAEAPVVVAGCGNAGGAYKTMGGYGNSIDIDVAIALDHLTLAAVAEGLGTCWIGAFDEQQVKRLLAVPAKVKVVALTPLGYPADTDLITSVRDEDRKRPEEIFTVDRY